MVVFPKMFLLSSLLLFTVPTLSYGMEDIGREPVKSGKKAIIILSNEASDNVFEMKSYPITTQNLEEAFSLCKVLFGNMKEHIEYMNERLEEVKKISFCSLKKSKYNEYFGILSLGRTIDENIKEISSLNEEFLLLYSDEIKFLSPKENTYGIDFSSLSSHELPIQLGNLLKNYRGAKEKSEESVELLEKKLRESLIIKRGYGNRKEGFIEGKEKSYIEMSRGNYLIDLQVDQVSLYSKIIEILQYHYDKLLPSSLFTESAQVITNTNEDQPQGKKLSVDEKKVDEPSSSKMDSHFPSLEKESLKQNVESTPLLAEASTLLTQTPENTSPQVKNISPSIQSEEKANPSPKRRKRKSHFQRNRKGDSQQKSGSQKRDDEKKSVVLTLNKNHYEPFKAVFSTPIPTNLRIDSFNNMICNGFKGRMYTENVKNTYEIYVICDELQKVLRFLSFKEYEKQKKESLVKKYQFTLHRPHPHGKNKKGTPMMYSALIKRARFFLEKFNLTPSTIAIGKKL